VAVSRRADARPSRRAPNARPLRESPGDRRSLSHVGGPSETSGDPQTAARLADALDVQAGVDDAALTHPFHAYPARMHPLTARRSIAIALDLRAARDSLAPGATSAPAESTAPRLVDPFCGSGTTLVEAFANGTPSIGRDLSPLAVELSRLKTRRTGNETRKTIVRQAHAHARAAQDLLRTGRVPPPPAGEAPWYEPSTLRELSLLRALIAAEPAGVVHDAMRMLLSSILVKCSLQRSDSDVRRADKNVPPGFALHWFTRKSFELVRCLRDLARAAPRECPEPDLVCDDATQLATIPSGSVSAIVTSPPYANTYDYAQQHARRFAWLDLSAAEMIRKEIGSSRLMDGAADPAGEFELQLVAMCASFRRVLCVGGQAIVLIGDGAHARIALRADEQLQRAATGAGLRVVARASQRRPSFSNDETAAYGSVGKREHLVLLGN